MRTVAHSGSTHCLTNQVHSSLIRDFPTRWSLTRGCPTRWSLTRGCRVRLSLSPGCLDRWSLTRDSLNRSSLIPSLSRRQHHPQCSNERSKSSLPRPLEPGPRPPRPPELLPRPPEERPVVDDPRPDAVLLPPSAWRRAFFALMPPVETSDIVSDVDFLVHLPDSPERPERPLLPPERELNGSLEEPPSPPKEDKGSDPPDERPPPSDEKGSELPDKPVGLEISHVSQPNKANRWSKRTTAERR